MVMVRVRVRARAKARAGEGDGKGDGKGEGEGEGEGEGGRGPTASLGLAAASQYLVAVLAQQGVHVGEEGLGRPAVREEDVELGAGEARVLGVEGGEAFLGSRWG